MKVEQMNANLPVEELDGRLAAEEMEDRLELGAWCPADCALRAPCPMYDPWPL